MSIEKKYIEDVLHPFIRPHNNQFSSKGRGRAGIIMMMDNDGKGILAPNPRPDHYDNDVHNVYAVRHGPCALRPYPSLPDRPIAPPRRTAGHCRAIPAKQVSRPFACPPHSIDTKKPPRKAAGGPRLIAINRTSRRTAHLPIRPWSCEQLPRVRPGFPPLPSRRSPRQRGSRQLLSR